MAHLVQDEQGSAATSVDSAGFPGSPICGDTIGPGFVMTRWLA